MDEYGAAFGFFPQLKPRRNINTDTSSLPLDVFRGRLAGLLGAPSDILNLLSSPKPMEVFGDVDYSPNPQLPYGSEQWLKELPLPPTSQAGNVLGKAASFVPLNPAPVIRGVQKAGQIAGEELAATMLGQRPNSLLDKVVPKPMFAVPPEQGLLTPAPVEPATSLLQTKPQAPVSDIGFYSAAEQAAMNIKRNAGPGQAMLNDILKGENVKADEIKWMGLDDFLRDKKNVTKQEVQDYIAQNRVDVQEVMLGDNPTRWEGNTLLVDNNPVGEIRDTSSGYAWRTPDGQYQLLGANRMFDAVEKVQQKLGVDVPEPSKPKFGQYTLPGGENYREILLTMPTNMGAYNDYVKTLRAKYGEGGLANLPLTEAERARLDKFYANEDVQPYKSSHWEQPNVLAHIRVNDRVDADGKKMLLIEEVQSDWHQAGREKGYETPELKSALKEYELLVIKNANGQKLTPDEMARVQELRPIVSGKSGGVPDAPFKDTWYQLALKRAMKYAADNGYDRVGLTTGARQAERYKLSNEVDEINVTGRTDARTGEKTRSVALDLKSGTSYRLGVNNDGVIDNVNMSEIDNFKGKKLSEVVGKDIAKQIMEGSSQTIKGEGLNIGGEGMKKYYDEIYPKFLDKYGKKWGAKVGETKIDIGDKAPSYGMLSIAEFEANRLDGESMLDYIKRMKSIRKTEPIRYIDITPEMRTSTSKGQPLFSAAPLLPTTGLLADEEKRKELKSLLEY